MKYIRVLIAFLFLLTPSHALATEVKEYQLKNGIKVIIIEEHKAPVATFQVWYKVGARDELGGKSGLSHLLEHMMFKGTARYGPSEFSRIIQKNGGTDNAYTTKDYTVYFEIMPSDKISLAIELEADRMKNLKIVEEEFISERDVVLEERRLRYEDDPQNALFEEVVAAAFKVHPYQRPVIGWMSDIKSIERDDLFSYYKTWYTPENALLIVMGDVNADDIIKKVRDSFEDIPAGNFKKNMEYTEPEQKGERRVFIKKEAELPYLLVAYHTTNFPHEDSYALDVLNMILSGGKSSRLYQSLVYEKKIALNASAYYNGFNKDPYLFFLSATSSPGTDIKEVEKSLYSEIDKIIEGDLSERELQKVKNQIEASFIMDQDSIFKQAMNYGMFEMLGGWRLIDRYLEGIRMVSYGDIQRVAKKYFHEDNRTVGILIPTKKLKSEQ